MLIHWIVSGVTGNQASGYRSNLASNRYRAILPAEGLRQLGHTVEMLDARAWSPAGYRQKEAVPDVVVLGKLLPGANLDGYIELSQRLRGAAEVARQRGCKVLADINDDHFEHPQLGFHWRGLLECVDGITAGSDAMADRIRQFTAKPVFVIGDPVAATLKEPTVFQRPTGLAGLLHHGLNRLGYMSERLRLSWFGSHTNWPAMADWAEKLVPLAQEQPFMINVISSSGMGIEADIDQFNQKHEPHAFMQFTPWEEHTVWDQISESHMVLIPSELGDQKKQVKTANRLIDALACGRFVIASPVPAYKRHSDCAWLGDDPLEGVSWALNHSDQSLEMVRRGQAMVVTEYGQETNASQWAAAFRDLAIKTGADMLFLPTPVSVASGDTRVRLNLGCGDKILDGYVNVDVAASRGGKAPDVLCDLHELDQFADNSADEILAVHVVEHFWRWEVVDILKEWARVLKPGGKMILECPNLISACEEFLKDPERFSSPDAHGQRTMWVFYGDPAWADPLMVHRWGYTPKSLAEVMAQAGLVNLRQQPAEFKLREPRDMRVVGEKQTS